MTANNHAPDSSGFVPPPVSEMRRLLAFNRAYFNPEFLGLWELDLEKPALFVGNHTLLSLDVPLIVEHLWSQYGVMLRSLGDSAHFKVPGWGALLERMGTVLATPDNCADLMKQGSHVLVFPGGGREVLKRKGEANKLIWKNRTGFARMAIAHGYDIIPIGSLGGDECFKIMIDGNDVLNSRIWKWLSAYTGIAGTTRGGDMIPPALLGLGPSPLPRPQRYYFGFGKRISTEHLKGREEDSDALWAVRDEVAAAIETQIARLLRYRQEDRYQNWSFLRRWLAPVEKIDLPDARHNTPTPVTKVNPPIRKKSKD